MPGQPQHAWATRPPDSCHLMSGCAREGEVCTQVALVRGTYDPLSPQDTQSLQAPNPRYCPWGDPLMTGLALSGWPTGTRWSEDCGRPESTFSTPSSSLGRSREKPCCHLCSQAGGLRLGAPGGLTQQGCDIIQLPYLSRSHSVPTSV